MTEHVGGQFISCPYCSGQGKIAEHTCNKCKGNGLIPLSEIGSGFIVDDNGEWYHD